MTTPFHIFTGWDLPSFLDQQAQVRGERPFLIWESLGEERHVYSYGEFARETRAYAAGLTDAGISKGEFVAIHMDNCPEFLLAWYALSRIGAVAVTTNTSSTAQELNYLLSYSKAVAVLTQPKFVTLVRKAAPELRWIACTKTDSGTQDSTMRPDDVIAFEDLRGDPDAWAARKAEPMLPNSLLYTSGTTAQPKGVVWTHANALWSGRTTATHMKLTEDDVGIVYFPLFHANALALQMLATLWAGASAVLMPKWSTSRFWEIARRNQCTWAGHVVFTMRAIQGQPDPVDHHFRLWTLAGDLSAIRERWGIKTMGIYGMTEMVSICAASLPTLVGPEGAMGRPGPEYQIAIRREDGSDAHFGEVGELCVKGIPGLSLFLEYLDDPVATANAFDGDGWLKTGDQVMAMEDGHLFFSGRSKDMLKVGGENVAASEIESVINRISGITDSAVVGKRDTMLDEVPVAFVVATNPGAELRAEIVAVCESKLSSFKRPREIHFRDHLPKGVLDKTLKKVLREELE